MLQIQQLKLSVSEDEKALNKKVANKLKISPNEIKSIEIVKKSIDARKKPDLFYIYTLLVLVADEEKIIRKIKDDQISKVSEKEYCFPTNGEKELAKRPVIIGMGPAGLFCGYMLSKYGFKPIIYERGKRVEDRILDVENFWNGGKLLLNSNVQFGEGGAGTFSDGKLNTLIKDKFGRNKEVLKIFVENGAPEEIIYESKPHIGTDILSDTVKNMRQKMINWGADINYESQVTDFIIKDNRLNKIVINNNSTVDVEHVILAIGHSARDTFKTLYERKVPMEAKSFAVGMRVQHPQECIDINQYGNRYKEYKLPPSIYKLTAKTSSNRGVYSFCMCPGGFVVNASSEENALAVNGMSYHNRDSKVANSAIIVTVTTDDFGSHHPLSGVEFQRELEKKAFDLGNGAIPIQYYKDFKGESGNTEVIKNPFEPKIKGLYQFADLRKLMSPQMNVSFIEGMEQFNRLIPGFSDDYVVLAGVESRTSSPVRINRKQDMQSGIEGLYPCGEGAGYAGGITSAAMDGLCVAETLASKYKIL